MGCVRLSTGHSGSEKAFAKMAVSPRIRHLGIVIVLLSLVAFISRLQPHRIDGQQLERNNTPDIKSEKLSRLQPMDAAVSPPPPESCSDTTLTNLINRVATNNKRSMTDLAQGPLSTRCGRFHWELKGSEFSVEGPNLCHAGIEDKTIALEGKCTVVYS